MPVNVKWLLSGSIIYSSYSGDVSLDDIEMASKQKTKMVQEKASNNAFHLIVDTRDIIHYPRNVAAIHARMRSFSNSRIGWIIIVTDNFYIQHLGAIFARLMNTRMHPCETLKEAYQFLQQVDGTSAPDEWPDDIDDTMPQRPSFNGKR